MNMIASKISPETKSRCQAKAAIVAPSHSLAFEIYKGFAIYTARFQGDRLIGAGAVRVGQRAMYIGDMPCNVSYAGKGAKARAIADVKAWVDEQSETDALQSQPEQQAEQAPAAIAEVPARKISPETKSRANATSQARALNLFAEGYTLEQIDGETLHFHRPKAKIEADTEKALEDAAKHGGTVAKVYAYYTLDVSELAAGVVHCDCLGYGNYGTCAHAQCVLQAYFATLPVEATDAPETMQAIEAAQVVPVTAMPAPAPSPSLPLCKAKGCNQPVWEAKSGIKTRCYACEMKADGFY